MRLKHLTLHGFKTFAPRTDLRFGEGLTAIVGPNGSGKSNVADAVRWVLGEQALSNLRAKKTEDLIFSGSSNRAPLGMAEVSITLDNADRLLPLEFAEITLTRRAFRTGENEYYINKSRVRLRDVLEISQSLGEAYTVVGQGLVDAALSLRPEERRELFEEAASIRGYFTQREDALRRLSRTEENVARVNDLASELEPQVRRMERQAKQAQEYQKLECDLHTLLKTWYASRWAHSIAALRRAEEAEREAEQTVAARKAEVATKDAALQEVRARAWGLVDSVSGLHARRAKIQDAHASKSQAHAVMGERLISAQGQRRTLLQEQAGLAASRTALERQLRVLEADAAERAAEISTLQESEREVTAQLAGLDAQVKEAEAHHSACAGKVDALQKRVSDLQGRLRDAHAQAAKWARSAEEGEAGLVNLQSQLDVAEVALGKAHSDLLAAQEAVGQASRAQSAAGAALDTARSARSAAEAHRRDLLRQCDALASQIASLVGEQQASLYGGVRAVVAAARDGRLSGYVGTVAELLQVPPDLEIAIEAALGGRLQEVVMSRWADAERAIALLKQTGAGRATFLPLDTLRVSPLSSPPRGAGIVGAASDLVKYDPSLRSLAEMLLGRLLIVEDLPSARKTIATLHANAPWTLATLDGEVVRPGGSVTGGSNTRAGDKQAQGRTLLARERKRRELAATQEAIASALAEAEREVEEADAAVRRCDANLGQALSLADAARKQQVASQAAHMEKQGIVSRLRQEIAWREGLLADARTSAQSATNLQTSLYTQIEEAEKQVGPLRQELQAAKSRLDLLLAQRQEVAHSTAASQTRIAVLGEALRYTQARQHDLHSQLERNSSQHAALQQRISQAEEEETRLARQIEAHTSEMDTLAQELAQIEAQVGPSEQEVKSLEGDVSRVEAEQSALQASLLESETLHSRALVERERSAGVLDTLWLEISEELGEDAAPTLAHVNGARNGNFTISAGVAHGNWRDLWERDSSPDNLPLVLPLASSGVHIPLAEGEMADLERRIVALKSKLSRIGPVNPLAMEEHATLSERHTYLRGQLQDLASAAETLRRVIGELDRTMREQFAATFAEVNEAFSTFFTTLFAGGSARLELTNPHDYTATGIEISAQPPGKRMQTLAALSGGERALTSVALLCALLKVRPVPFCVLDEVDAALDESNVTRFRAALQELGAKTQFVIVTHNRGTIEAADTLYGVSMAGDGTSKLLSLKVPA
jgi:chromosome segregation protein